MTKNWTVGRHGNEARYRGLRVVVRENLKSVHACARVLVYFGCMTVMDSEV